MSTPRPIAPVAFARGAALLALLVLAACARDAGDWKSAQQADTQAAYDAFLAKHPDSEFAAQARTRAAQLAEERDWGVATQADTPEAYQKFVAQHADGKWTQEARIRIENFNVMAANAPEAPVETAAAAGATASKAGAPAPKPVVATTPAGTGSSAGTKQAQSPVATPVATPAPAPVSAPPPARPVVASTAAPRGSAVAKPADAAPAPGGAARVQLGAFSSVDKAEAEWTRARARFTPLQALEPRITPADTRVGRLFRLQAALPDAAAAKALCDELKAAGQACLVVPAK